MKREGWPVPADPWVLHVAPYMDTDDKGFVDVQAAAHDRFETRLLMIRAVGQSARPSHWVVAADNPVDYAALRAAIATGGRSVPLLARRFRANPPAVIHGHYGPTAFQLARFAERQDVPLFASFYGYDASLSSIVDDPRWQARYRRLFATAAGAFAEGPAMGRRIAALGCPEDRIHVVRLPIDETVLAGVRYAPPEQFVVGAAGRLVEKKGFDTAIRAFARAFRDVNDARMSIVGGGPLADDLQRLAQEEGVSDRITWHGTLPFTEFTRMASRCSVAVFPSRTASTGDSEGGAPVTLIELQWLGVPAVVSDHDDLPFIAAPELPVVAANDVDAWADVLRSVYEDRSLLMRLGAAGREFVHAHHSPAQNAATREAVYAEAL